MVLSRHADREAEKALDGVYRGEDGWNQGAASWWHRAGEAGNERQRLRHTDEEGLPDPTT
jgi:hypothetical protein